MVTYIIGGKLEVEPLYPDPSKIDPSIGLKTYADVIKHFTASSLEQDGIQIQPNSLTVQSTHGGYRITFDPLPPFQDQAIAFGRMHQQMLDEDHGLRALEGVVACAATPAWNPMAGYPVNKNDGPSEWLLYLPLGMPIANQRSVTLLHYPPIVAYRKVDYLNNMTLRRWSQLLTCVGVATPSLYHSIIDVNPIAAPGSGESEYPNDYFPINLTSLFFDNDKDIAKLTYVRSMLELMLNPPWNANNPYTIPLLVCGSPLYDPQAPGWFRTRYKDQLPKDKNGSPTVSVLQAGFVQINPASPKKTPYMIANHMIAAGVTGKCTDDPKTIPNIQKYEAQDLVAATFLSLYASNPAIDPSLAAQQACQRWFGAPNGDGAPNPPSSDDRLTICALAQMDLCFDSVKIAPKYTYAQARARCQQKGGPSYNPCFGCAPL